MSESAYLSIPARAIFNGKSVIVQGVGAKFDGQRQQDAMDQEVTSDGVLYYQGLPEGNISMSFSSSSSTTTTTTTTTTTNYEIEIEFKEDGAAAGADPGQKFVGTVPGPLNGSGSGTWKSIDIYQQVAVLSLFSNMIKKEKETIEGLQSLANKKVNFDRPQGWDVVWGPVVWKNDPNNQFTGPDHVWFVAKKLRSAGPVIYVISVAGSATIYNHLVNNSGVVQVVDFTTWVANTPPSPTSTIDNSCTYIAFGMAQGVHTLYSYPAPDGAAGAGKTLPDFLKNAERGSESGTQFIFTGFGLGGALSSTLALALKKTSADVFKNLDKVMTYSIASASPGNLHFAELFAQEFPKISDGSEPYQVWNANIANLLDIVIYAWSTSLWQLLNLQSIPKIYGNDPALPAVEKKINLAKDASNKSGTFYIPLQNTLFTPAGAVTRPKTEKDFRKTAMEQHTTAYLTYFGLPKGSNFLRVQARSEDRAVEVDLEELFPDLDI